MSHDVALGPVGPELVLTEDGQIQWAHETRTASQHHEPGSADIDRGDPDLPAPDLAQAPWRVGVEEATTERGVEYRACLPVKVADLDVPSSAHARASADEATMAVARLDATVVARFGDDARHVGEMFLRLDALGSSAIEHIHSTPRGLASASALTHPEAVDLLVAANTDAIRTAVTLQADSVDISDLLAIHHSLLAGTRDFAGSVREGQVWIGGAFSTVTTAAFVPPVARRVPALLDDLCVFIARTDLPGLTQTAVAHAQFETIHPYADGNGRAGRALAQGMLRRLGATTAVVPPLSVGLAARVSDYYSALTGYRDGNLDAIVEVFAQATLRASQTAQALVDDIEETMREWRWRIEARSDAAVWRLLPHLIASPALTVNEVAATCGVSFPAAQRAVDQMAAADVVKPLNDQRRGRAWIAPDVLDLMDGYLATMRARRW